MTNYVKSMINIFPDKLEGIRRFPWTDRLFTVDTKSTKHEYHNAKFIYDFVMKGMFLCKRPRKTGQSARTHVFGNRNFLAKQRQLCKANQDYDFLECNSKWGFIYESWKHSYSGMFFKFTMELHCHLEKELFVLCLRNTRSLTEAELVGVDDII